MRNCAENAPKASGVSGIDAATCLATATPELAATARVSTVQRGRRISSYILTPFPGDSNAMTKSLSRRRLFKKGAAAAASAALASQSGTASDRRRQS